MVVVYVLRLLTNPMTNKVGMVRAWTGLGKILDVRQINLLGRPLDLQRTSVSVSAYNTNMNGIFVSTNLSSSESYYLKEYYKVMQQHFSIMGLSDDD